MRRLTTIALAAALLVPGSLSASADSPDVEDVIDGLALDIQIATSEHAGAWGMGGVRPAPNVNVPPTVTLTPGEFYPASSELIDGVGSGNVYHLVEVDDTLGFVLAMDVHTYRSGFIDPATLTEPATVTRAEAIYEVAIHDLDDGLYGEGKAGQVRAGEQVHSTAEPVPHFGGMTLVRTVDGTVGWVSSGAIELGIATDDVEKPRDAAPSEDPETEEPAGDTEAPPAATSGSAEDDDSLPVGLLVGLGAGVLVVGGLVVARARGRSQRAASTEPAAEELTYDDGDDDIEDLVYEEDDR